MLTRTDALLDAVSARYASPGVSGVRELDRYGSWRVVPTYGSVWVPAAVSADWVSYSTGGVGRNPEGAPPVTLPAPGQPKREGPTAGASGTSQPAPGPRATTPQTPGAGAPPPQAAVP